MKDVYSFSQGTVPLLVSVPHDGRLLMPGQAERMTESGRALPDTDWFVRDLYAFATNIGASVIAAEYSRYVVDLNRPADDTALYAGQLSTGLCPMRTFAGSALYRDNEVIGADEQRQRVEQYWQPYHDKIASVLEAFRLRHGIALLWDAHSIASAVPALFSGVLPDLNLGTHGGRSCGANFEASVVAAAEASTYSTVLNGRFRGGFITRHYGDPENSTHAIQLELSQRCYMDENELSYDSELANKLSNTLSEMLKRFVDTAQHDRDGQ